MKTGKLSQAEKEYIANNYKSLDVAKIARKLNRSTKQVQQEIDGFSKQQSEVTTETQTKVSKQKTLFATVMEQNTRVRNGQKIATVMSAAASEICDGARKNKPKPNKDSLHKPMG